MADERPAPDGAREDGETPQRGEGFRPIESQGELDRIVADRLARERRKYADYDELRARAARLDELEAAGRTELERAVARAEAAEARAAELERREQAEAWRREVSAATGVDARLLTGSTREEMEAFAATYLEINPPRPPEAAGVVPSEGGAQAAPAAQGDWLRERLGGR